jgi:hypothetical protein
MDFFEVTITALKQKPRLPNAGTIIQSASSQIQQMLARIVRRRTERKVEDVLEEDQFGFRRGKGTRDATRMMRILE